MFRGLVRFIIITRGHDSVYRRTAQRHVIILFKNNVILSMICLRCLNSFVQLPNQIFFLKYKSLYHLRCGRDRGLPVVPTPPDHCVLHRSRLLLCCEQWLWQLQMEMLSAACGTGTYCEPVIGCYKLEPKSCKLGCGATTKSTMLRLPDDYVARKCQTVMGDRVGDATSGKSSILRPRRCDW